VLIPPVCGILFGGLSGISVTWCVYEDCCVLTGQVSPFCGLSVSLCTIPSLSRQPHILFEWGGGGLGEHWGALACFSWLGSHYH